MMRVTVGNMTDTGRARRENQDYFGDFEPEESASPLGRLLIVADGVGGHRGGRLASRIAVDVVAETYFGPMSPPAGAGEAAIGERLRRAFDEANRRILRKGLDDPGLRGMATTCTTLVLLDGQVQGAHVGDSRAYLLRGGRLRRLSRDHSLLQEALDRGLDAGDSLHDGQRNVITRALGVDPEMETDLLAPQALYPGDRLLLCSDGLHALVPEEEIASLLGQDDPLTACERLVARANEKGGLDNITVQAIRIDEP